MELTDTDIMPFGRYKGSSMQDVPVNYLHWIYHNAYGDHTKDVMEYIKKNLSALKLENKNLLWTKSDATQ